MIRNLFTYALLAGFLACSAQQVLAQDSEGYKHAIGGRFGVANGVTFKNFINDSHAIDALLNFRSNNDYSVFRLIGLYEIHRPIDQLAGLQWYYGAGAGLGSYRDKSRDPNGNRRDSELAFSLDGVIGLDYKFNQAPINMALDWKPALEVAPDAGVNFEGFGLSVRFTF